MAYEEIRYDAEGPVGVLTQDAQDGIKAFLEKRTPARKNR